MQIDIQKVRREQLRWMILLALNNGRPERVAEALLQGVAQSIYTDATALEIRREMDYLHDRRLIEVHRSPSGPWSAALTRYGVDMAEYTIDCAPGIGRPEKYW